MKKQPNAKHDNVDAAFKGVDGKVLVGPKEMFGYKSFGGPLVPSFRLATNGLWVPKELIGKESLNQLFAHA